ISDIRDESDKDGMRIVIDLKKEENSQIILNNLYKHTSMKTSFGVIMLALVDQQPQILNLKGMLAQYVEYRKKVVVRRTKFDLDKAESRLHLLEGFMKARKAKDIVLKIIKDSEDREDLKNNLMKRLKLSMIQAYAVGDLRAWQLTKLELNRMEEEYKGLLKFIEKLKDILADSRNVLAVVKEELLDIKTRYGDERRSQIIAKQAEINIEDLIKDEEVVVTMSHLGYVKRLPVTSYKAQKRGGKGVTGTETKDDDFVEDLFVTTTKDYLMFFTNRGKVYWLKVYEIPEAGRYSKGRPIVNLIKLETQEQITAAISVKEFKATSFVVMATKHGMIKKTKLSEFSNPRSSGIIALRLRDGDELIGVKITTGKQDVMMATRNGYSLRTKENDIREIGRSGIGVKGMKLGKNDFIIGMEVAAEKASLLTVTERGFGKRTDLGAYRVQGRGGKGLINIKTSEKTGLVIGIKEVHNDDEVMVMTTSGVVIRSKVSDIRMTGRSTSGVRLIRLAEGDKATAVARLASKDEEVGGK
ncbi:MAG: DNA gyrase C-terminal beta-propeller domain-containing protein, partial [Candidatus Firestonebacteria bacterium]